MNNFRLYDKKIKEYVKSSIAILLIDIVPKRGHGFSIIPVENNFILEWSTGIIDKNGKEIYEGDIIKGIPLYRDLKPYFFSIESVIPCWNISTRIDEEIYQYLKVGDIHNNPDLLEVSK